MRKDHEGGALPCCSAHFIDQAIELELHHIELDLGHTTSGVRSQPSQQPHELNITPALAFQLAAGAHLVEVSIDVRRSRGS